MKNIKLTVLALLTTVFSISLATYADKNDCPPGVVHCAYMTGLSDAMKDGRYIKVANAKIGSVTVCFNGTSTVFLEQTDGQKYMGDNADTYSICSDAFGKVCETIGVDRFVVSVKQGQYSSEPMFYSIDVSTLKDKFPACDSLTKAKL